MYTKQEIILQSYPDGFLQRQISRYLNISSKTAAKYITQYTKRLTAASTSEALTEYISEQPSYNIATRDMIRLTQDAQDQIDKLLDQNHTKRMQGIRKQQLAHLALLLKFYSF